MSSHHIVRDDQEPALIIANGASCSEELMGQLLEWSPLVIVLDSAIERVLELGIKVDVLLGDFDRGFNPEYYLEKQYPLEIVHTPNQEKTDLEKAFDYLIDKGHKAVNVIWATGKRADHTITNITGLSTALTGKVNTSQVLTNVPAGAVFTDTVYIKPANEPISYITGLQTALTNKAAVFTGYTGSVTVVTGVDFVAQTVTTKVVTYSNGIVTSIV